MRFVSPTKQSTDTTENVTSLRTKSTNHKPRINIKVPPKMNFDSCYSVITVLDNVKLTKKSEVTGLYKIPYGWKMLFQKNSRNNETIFEFYMTTETSLVPITVNIICQEGKSYGVVELTTFHINQRYQEYCPSVLESLLEYFQNKGLMQFRYTLTHKSEKKDAPINAYFLQLVDKKVFRKSGPACEFTLNNE